MRREDGKGRCETCGAVFPYEIVHNGFNDSMHAYCDHCGRTAILGLVEAERRAGRTWDRVVPLPAEIERLLAPCTCGGSFRGKAPARCPVCREPLSAKRAAEWLEAQAPGTSNGWRWQRSWAGLYALILGERVVFDPWRAKGAGEGPSGRRARGQRGELEIVESGGRLEIRSPMPAGRRFLFALLALVPLLAPWELLVRVRWTSFVHPFFFLAAIVSAGALAVSAFLLFAAVAGLESRMVFDRNAGVFTWSASAPVVRLRSRRIPLGAIQGVELVTHEWSDGSPSYSLRVVTTRREELRTGSSWSREEVEGTRSRVLGFLGLPG